MSDETDLYALLAGEIERRLPALQAQRPDESEVRAAFHSLKGSAGMAGFNDLALVVAQLGARVRGGDDTARSAAAELLGRALVRLRAGQSAFPTSWPEPPPMLGAASIEPDFRAEYLAAMRDRLGEIDGALASDDAPKLAVERAYRSVHGMKGAAGAVGDDATAWYCHGLEARLKRVLAGEQAPDDALVDLARHRAIIALLLEQPVRALATLRTLAGRQAMPDKPPSSRPPSSRAPGSPPPTRPPPDDDEEEAEELLHVPSSTADRFLERLERIDLVQDELSGTAESVRQIAARLRDLRASLLEALRLIGPPRPWGAPAAALAHIDNAAHTLGAAADSADRSGMVCRRNAEVLHSRTTEMRATVSTLRRTTVRWLFDRVSHGIERLAAREGHLVEIHTSGANLPIDRRVAQRLLDPMMQLARNAVAHGIESPEDRARSGKAKIGNVTLHAERIGDWVRIVVSDDGRGVDVERIRKLAVESGAITREAAGSAHEDELLAMLFLPGLTTRDAADLLAGRGVGLDLAKDTIRRLGGAIRLAGRAGGGLAATIEVPSERGMVEVLWLEAGDLRFALPVGFTGRLAPASAARNVPLPACLGLPDKGPPKLALELQIRGVQPISIGIDQAYDIEEVSVRPVPPLIAAAGPYSGAILRGDGSLRLALDAALLAARAWSLVS